MFSAGNTNQVQPTQPSLPSRSPRYHITMNERGLSKTLGSSRTSGCRPCVFLSRSGWFPTAEEMEKCQRLANDTQRRVAVICGDPGWETMVCCCDPEADYQTYLPLPDFLMQWVHAEIVMRAIDNARSARFEFGETPQVLPFPQPVAQPTAART